jgi:hypothetical protein
MTTLSYPSWLALGATVLNRSHTFGEVQFQSSFKLPTQLVEIVWNRLVETEGNVIKSKHFLWALHFLKTDQTNLSEIATYLSTNRKTLKLHVYGVLHRLNHSLPEVFLIMIIYI